MSYLVLVINNIKKHFLFETKGGGWLTRILKLRYLSFSLFWTKYGGGGGIDHIPQVLRPFLPNWDIFKFGA